jgi:hypothetical protein
MCFGLRETDPRWRLQCDESLADSQWRGGLATHIQAALRAAGPCDDQACENGASGDNDGRSG